VDDSGLIYLQHARAATQRKAHAESGSRAASFAMSSSFLPFRPVKPALLANAWSSLRLRLCRSTIGPDVGWERQRVRGVEDRKVCWKL
jgi:hypothetical protein